MKNYYVRHANEIFLDLDYSERFFNRKNFNWVKEHIMIKIPRMKEFPSKTKGNVHGIVQTPKQLTPMEANWIALALGSDRARSAHIFRRIISKGKNFDILINSKRLHRRPDFTCPCENDGTICEHHLRIQPDNH